MASLDDDFEALLKTSSLGSAAAGRLRERTPLSRAHEVRRIIELRDRIAHFPDRPDEAAQAAHELLQVLADLGHNSQGEIPDELRDAEHLARKVVGTDDRGDGAEAGHPPVPPPAVSPPTSARPSRDRLAAALGGEAGNPPDSSTRPVPTVVGSGSQTPRAHGQAPEKWPARSLLGRLSHPARRELLGLGTAVQFTEGAVLLEEEMNDRHALLLLSGFAKITTTLANGETFLIAVMAGGDTVGEMAALDGAPRSATVTACGPLTARMVPPGELQQLLARRPEVSTALSTMVTDRLRCANRRLLEFRGHPAKVRLARLLLGLAASYGSPHTSGTTIEYRITQPELAALIDASEPTVHKALHELRNVGLLETHYRSLVIHDLSRLADLAETGT